MSLTLSVEEILKIGKLSSVSVLAGARGLSTRFVKTCVVIDVPDAHLWVRGGELLISSGYLFAKNPLELLPLVEGCAMQGAAALGIKVGRFLGELPREVLTLADRLEFPLLNIPPQVNHSDIVNPVLSAIVNRQFELLRHSSEIRDFFLDRVVNGGQIEEILDGFESFSGCPVRLIQDEAERSFESRGIKAGQAQDLISERSEPLVLGGRKVGTFFFLAGREPMGELAKVALAHAKTAVIILLQQDIALWEAERRHGEEFLQDLLFRRGAQTQDLAGRARLIGWKHEGPLAVALVKAPGQFARDGRALEAADIQRVCRSCARLARARIRGSLSTDVGGLSALILPVEENPEGYRGVQLAVEAIRSELERFLSISVIAALGAAKPALVNVGESYSEARETLDILERTRRVGCTVSWEDLRLDRVLVLLRDTEAGHDLVRKCLGALLEADAKSRGKSANLVRTLDVLVRCNWHLNEAADTLSIHYNTLKNRLDSIARLLDVNLEDSHARMEVALALALHKMDNQMQA